MATATQRFSGGTAPNDSGIRREERSKTVRIVEYAGFPRVAPHRHLRVGFTRDLSRSGMCLGVYESERVGSLLRLCVRDLEGRSTDACIGRVVWTSAEQDGRFWLGIELLTQPPTRDIAARRRREGELRRNGGALRA